MMIFLNGCVSRNKRIYETDLKPIEVTKLIQIDEKLMELEPIPYWESESNPKYIDLKSLLMETRSDLQFCHGQILEIREVQSNGNKP